MSPDRTLLGVALMLGFCVSAPLIDVASKLAAATVPVGEVTAARFLVQGLATLPFMAGHPWGLPRDLLRPLLLRAVLLIVSTFAFVSAVDVMPVADALAIVFVMPFMLLVLGRVLHGERVGRHRVLACAAGFGGSLLVIQPSLAAFGWAALWPLLTAGSFALYMLVTRGLAGRMHPVPMQVHTSALALALCAPILWAAAGTGAPALDPVWPAGLAWAWLAGVGAASALAHLLMAHALRLAPSATLAPLEYLEIVTAVALGYLVWGDFPDPLTGAGIGVIVGSGLFVIHRERRAARRGEASAAPPAAPPRPAGAPRAAG